MKSSNLPYNPRIDQLRWLAATIVFLFHFYYQYLGSGAPGFSSAWAGIVTEGHTGVGLFFTLSGFLFMRIAARQQQIVYAEFVRNRFLRIFPLFLCIFLVAISITRDAFQPQDLLYILTTNLGHSPTAVSVVTGAAWCISLEFMFYLVFPFLSRFALEQGKIYLVKLLVLMLCFKLATYSENERSTLMYFSTFVGRFDQFLIGMLVAMLYQEHATLLHRYAGRFLPLACALVVSNSALQAHWAAFNVTPKSPFWIGWSMLESCGWSCVILSWVSFDKKLPAWLERGLCHGGKISFSFYLLHAGVIHTLVAWFGFPKWTGLWWMDGLLALGVSYALTWALATLSYAAIEEPFLRMRRAYGGGALTR